MQDKILAKVEENEKEIIELLRTVIKIPSLTGEEGEAKEFIAIDDYLAGVKTLALSIYHWCT